MPRAAARPAMIRREFFLQGRRRDASLLDAGYSSSDGDVEGEGKLVFVADPLVSRRRTTDLLLGQGDVATAEEDHSERQISSTDRSSLTLGRR